MHQLNAPIVPSAALSIAHLAGAAELNKKDSQYMSDTAQGLMSEVKLGGMAQKQAQDDGVKQFGKRMVDDHADPDVKKFAAASYKTASMHNKVVDGLHARIGK